MILIVGAYGSGKTEVAINLAVKLKKEGRHVRLCDLDLVNPYFRTREALHAMERMEIEIVTPEKRYLNADLPIVDPAVLGMLRDAGSCSIIDVGGDDAGATVLGSLAGIILKRDFSMLQVINPYRPGADTIEGCLKVKKAIESISRLNVTGVIGNANLMDETEEKHVQEGHRFSLAYAKAGGLHLEFLAIPDLMARAMDLKSFSCPVLPIKRYLKMPWTVGSA